MSATARQPVDLLDPQLAHVGEDGRALGDGGGDGQSRDLVERRDLAGPHLGGMQGPGMRPDGRGAGLAGDEA